MCYGVTALHQICSYVMGGLEASLANPAEMLEDKKTGVFVIGAY